MVGGRLTDGAVCLDMIACVIIIQVHTGTHLALFSLAVVLWIRYGSIGNMVA